MPILERIDRANYSTHGSRRSSRLPGPLQALIVVSLVTSPGSVPNPNRIQLEKEREKPDMGVKLFVGNLSYSITEQELREAFAQSGRTVQTVRIALDRETQRPRGFAFVEMAGEADAERAIKH